MTPPEPQTYTYAQLAERIEAALGVRPAASTLRAAAAEARRTPANQSRPRLTMGMPSPQPDGAPGMAVEFSAAEVDRWLAEHPWRGWAAARADLVEAAATASTSEHVAQAVGQARRSGMSWRQITEVLNTHGPVVRTMPAVHRAYRHLDDR